MTDPQKGVIQRVPVTPSPIAGTFTFPANRTAPTVPLPVMVRRPHTSPARVEVRAGVSRRLNGAAGDPGGTLEASGDLTAIHWFDSATGTNAITIPAAGLPLNKGQLNAGFRMFAESDTPTNSVGGYTLTLVLAPGGSAPLAASPASVDLTAVRLTLDVFPPGPTTGPGEPQPMPEPLAATAPAGTATDKWFLGRTVNVQDAALAQARARIRVRKVEPSSFPGRLSIRQLSLSGTTLGRSSARLALFDDDLVPPPGLPPPAVPSPAHPNPLAFDPPSLLGRDFFVEGRALSAARRDVAFQVGFEGGEPDGDRVAFTIGVGCSITIDNALRAVLVKKVPANPARRVVTLRTNITFARQGSFDLTAGNTPAKVQLFAAANGGAALALPIAAPGAQLSSATGFQLFVEGVAPSGSVDELALSLTLADGAPPAGVPATARMTAVELALDVFLSRPLAGGAAPLMPAADKVATGRFIQVASPAASHERAHLVVRPPNPILSCDLVLRALGPAPAAVRLFTDESPTVSRDVALPEKISSVATTIGAFDRFAEGVRPSALVRDTGFQLGIDTLDDDGDRVPMTALEFAVAENDTAAAPALSAVRFGLWDQGYNPGPAATPNQTTLRANFIDADRRRFHFHLRGPLGAASLQTTWHTMLVDRTTADDVPASAVLTLVAPPGGGRLVSPGVMLVIDNIDAAQPTPAARGAAEHRLRRARLDGFVKAVIQPSPGQLHQLVLPVFDRATPFDTTSASVIAGGGAAAVAVPAAMQGTAATGARWQIKVGSRLVVDTGANQEEVAVTAVAAASFTATFANAHNGGAAPLRIAGTTDERRRLRVRVVRYNNPADATYVSARDGDIRDQFAHANLGWNQVGLQIDAGATADRQIPAAALKAGKFPFVHPDGAEEQAVLADLIPITPDNTLTAVFLDMTGPNAYAAILQTAPVPLPAGGTVNMGDRFFIFLRSRLDPLNETLSHELHHVLHNRAHALAVADHLFTFNTNPPVALAALRGIALPDSRFYRRIHVLNSANPNLDPPNDDILNWFRRPRTARFPILASLVIATATTGNNLTEDF